MGKRRASGWWFLLGAGFILASIGTFVGYFAWLYLSVDWHDVPADGRSVVLQVESHTDHLINVDTDTEVTGCEVLDLDAGSLLPLHPAVAGPR